VVLGSLALNANGTLPSLGVEQGVIPPFWG
jgi:hypothetical protein